MKLGTWNVRYLYRSDSLTAAESREIARHKLDLGGVLEVKWENGGMVRAGAIFFFLWKENKNHQLETGFFVHHKRLTAFKTAVSVSDRCHI
jgi:hypothetical protein